MAHPVVGRAERVPRCGFVFAKEPKNRYTFGQPHNRPVERRGGGVPPWGTCGGACRLQSLGQSVLPSVCAVPCPACALPRAPHTLPLSAHTLPCTRNPPKPDSVDG